MARARYGKVGIYQSSYKYEAEQAIEKIKSAYFHAIKSKNASPVIKDNVKLMANIA